MALRALAEIDVNDRALFQHTLKLTLLNCPEDQAAFAILFDEFWGPNDPPAVEGPENTEEFPEEVDPPVNTSQDSEVGSDDIDELIARFDYESFWQEAEEDESGETSEESEPIDEFSDPPTLDWQSNTQDLRRLVRALANHFQAKNSRRLQSHRRGSMFDMRRLLKESVKFGGLPIDLRWRRKKQQRPRLILFVDVSRSMTSYAKLLLQFAEAVLRHAWQVDVFLFAKQIFHLTEKQLQDEDFDIVAVIEQCGGSTRIGANLNTFLKHYSYTLTGNRSIAIVLSDGLDGGDQEVLAETMERIKNRTKKLVWLNPVLDFQDMAHTEREMAAALPFIDLLAPAHNVECLWNLLALLQNETSPSMNNHSA